MLEQRKYPFSWRLLGDLKLGRPNLGSTARLEVYRLMQFTMRDVIEQRYGTEAADTLFYEAGRLAGTEFYHNVLPAVSSYPEFVHHLQVALKEMGIGILRIEEGDLEHGRWIMTVSEDLDCSGLPETGSGVCTYDEGFLAGLMESFTHQKFHVREIDCWCTGNRTCRFRAEVVE